MLEIILCKIQISSDYFLTFEAKTSLHSPECFVRDEFILV
ncbi:DEHA2E02552p [Debaryomyces hansenii CBS767]|uniref:DEHA2E02552p n=1 Tax=Debaryomyces hansenii (strain ATCC 36239 / CBS 767 / BCRC 21394 / JCM 1990 / NBRC 0083 / IGC 2968) TaxID=284592 RepID=W0TYS2_DEBHA|nr:DEHA2E02552p [Debaryomyces hansenii CBS767]CAG87656.4 DEHA2E02552p [Debaryomyces hansenii CBS767]|eukprot:XP_002770398.1 DEHA2E02552p [Debaryomyces hansenii CBS767]